MGGDSPGGPQFFRGTWGDRLGKLGEPRAEARRQPLGDSVGESRDRIASFVEAVN
jgi:hypothetical protein